VAKGKKTEKKKTKRVKEELPEAPRIDWGAVPKLVTDPRLIAPPSLPMRHDHFHPHVEEACHPEVRLVIKTRYMEQRPFVLLIESGILATIILLFFGLLMYMLRIDPSIYPPVLFAFWPLLIILVYKFFED
jgi:hypothetical protein